MADEGVREIQLDGKQLVFLFMSATVVAVVIFLCGVMVGRGAPLRVGQDSAAHEIGLDPTVQPATASPASTDVDAPVASDEKLYDSLLNDTGSADTLAPPSESPEPPRAEPVDARAQAAAARPSKPAPAPPARPVNLASRPASGAAAAAQPRSIAEPRGNGYVVQVAAMPKREEANAMARRLGSKGYPAFVTTSGSNYRVRIGKYTNRREAETVARKLEREERVEPWVTR